ncbi:MAG: hypothetical protein CMJ83_12780 [Planctomycetes bacterium]|nr:hypothetical protein [Planctomycetota bacterium]
MDDNARLAEEVRRVLWPAGLDDGFDPVSSWADLGRLLEVLEGRGCYLMTNSVNDPELRRMASLHRSTPHGYPCVGSSEWGTYARLGEAVLRAAHEALLHPRVEQD